MGMSADATIAWGVRVYEPDGDYDWDDDAASEAHAALGEKLEHFYDEHLDEILGWTEPHPGWPSHLRGLPKAQRDTDEYRAREALIADYEARHDAAVPVDTDHFGGDEYSGTVLVVKRTRTSVEWGCDPVDPATLSPPTEVERHALNVVLDHLGFTGDREPRLLLFAYYG